MASLVLGAAGAMLAPTGYAALGWTIGSTIGNILFPPSLPDIVNEMPRLTDLSVPSGAIGTMIPYGRGTFRLNAHPERTIWSTPKRLVEEVTEEEVGKGGGGQTVRNISRRYFVDIAMALHDGEIVGLDQLIIAGELVFNLAPGAPPATVIESNQRWASLTVYTGTETQDVDPTIESWEGEDNVPAFLDLAYMVIKDFEITAWGTVPKIDVRVVVDGARGPSAQYLDGLSGSTAAQVQLRYAPGRGEIWVADHDYGVYGTSPARIAIHNVESRAWEYIVLPGTDNFGQGIYQLMVLDPARDVCYVNAQASNLDEESRALVYQMSTRQLVQVANDLVNGGDARVRFQAVDPLRGRICLRNNDSGGRHEIWTVDNDGRLVARLSVIGSPNDFFDWGMVDADGDFWFNNVSAIARITAGGVKTFYSLGSSPDYSGQQGYMTMDAARGAIYYCAVDGPKLNRFDLATQAVTTLNASMPAVAWVHYDVEDDRIYAVSGGAEAAAIYVFKVDGTLEATHALPDLYTRNWSAPNFATAPGFLWSYSSARLAEFRFDSIVATAPALSDVVAKAVARRGLTEADIDVTQLEEDTVRGWWTTRIGSARAAIEPLMVGYQFDAVESDGKVKFVKRGGAPVATIGPDDLGVVREGEEWQAPVRVTSRLETELPYEVRVEYADVGMDYAQNVQPSRRLTGGSRDVKTLSLPLALTADQAKRIADLALYGEWAGREGIECATSTKYLHLEPTDVALISDGARSYTTRLEGQTASRTQIQWKGATEDIEVYDQTGTGAPGPAPVTTVSMRGDTALRLLDIPLLREVDDGLGVYVAAAGYLSGWEGHELFRSTDSTSFKRTGIDNGVACPMGFAATALGDWTAGNVFDEVNTVEVVLLPHAGALASVTRDEVLEGANACWLAGEILHFRTATLLAANHYRLSGLLRGRAGTEHAMDAHAIGDAFVLLTPTALQRLTLPAGDIGVTRYYKPVTLGRTQLQTGAQQFVFSAESSRPLAPVDLRIARDTSGNISGTFVRRSRYPYRMVQQSIDAPLGEASERYEIDICNSGFTEVRRTLLVDGAPAFDYSATDQAADWGSTQATIYVRCYQISAAVGRGHVLQGQG